ncbi:rCG21193, isoform CRA_a, partial [Rattus norvegicus]
MACSSSEEPHHLWHING